MEQKGYVEPTICVTYVNQHLTRWPWLFVKRVADGCQDTYSISFSPNKKAAVYRKEDTTDYCFSSYSMIQDCWDEEVVYDLTDAEDLEAFRELIVDKFAEPISLDATPEMLYQALSEAPNKIHGSIEGWKAI